MSYGLAVNLRRIAAAVSFFYLLVIQASLGVSLPFLGYSKDGDVIVSSREPVRFFGPNESVNSGVACSCAIVVIMNLVSGSGYVGHFNYDDLAYDSLKDIFKTAVRNLGPASKLSFFATGTDDFDMITEGRRRDIIQLLKQYQFAEDNIHIGWLPENHMGQLRIESPFQTEERKLNLFYVHHSDFFRAVGPIESHSFPPQFKFPTKRDCSAIISTLPELPFRSSYFP